MLVRALIVLMLSMGTCSSFSQEPIPGANESVQAPQSQPDQAGAAGVRSVPRETNPSKSEAETAAAETHAQEEKAATDKRLADFTAYLFYATAALSVIALLQFGVFWYQGFQLKRTVDSAERSNSILYRAYFWPGFGRAGPLPSGGWRYSVTIFNSGRTAGVLKYVYYALVAEQDFKAGNFIYTRFGGKENIIPPNMRPGGEYDTGVYHDVTEGPLISCGYVEFVDAFGKTQTQGWKHRLYPDSYRSDALPGCYSDPADKDHTSIDGVVA